MDSRHIKRENKNTGPLLSDRDNKTKLKASYTLRLYIYKSHFVAIRKNPRLDLMYS